MFTPFAFVKSAEAAAPSYTGILDTYPGAAFGYSFRRLRGAYTGNCIQIRKESDNSTQNIGFVNNYVDTASIASFVGAGSAQISIWYDQSGNAVNLTPTGDAGAGFRIVIGGTLQTLNGKVAGYTPNGFNYSMGANYTTTTNNLMWFDVSGADEDTQSSNLYGRILSIYKGTGNDYDNCDSCINFYGQPSPFSRRVATGQNNQWAYTGRDYVRDTQYINFHYKDSNTMGGNTNGGTNATVSTGCGSAGLNATKIRLGNDYRSADSSMTGWIQETILWNTYTSGNQSGIVTNANTFYGTF
jgi:hypothetical protein